MISILYFMVPKRISCMFLIAFLSWCSTGALIFGIIEMSTTVRDKEIAKQNSKYIERTCNITSSQQNPYKCAAKRNCHCAEAPLKADSCAHMLSNLISGHCNGGYKCCRTKCDTCYKRCRYCRQRENGKCIKSGSRDCYPHDCNCKCVKSVKRQLCSSYVSNCYHPKIQVQYYIGTLVSQQNYAKCLIEQELMEIDPELHDDNCAHHLIHQVSFRKRCGIDDKRCVNQFLDPYPLGSIHTCLVRTTNPNEVHMDGDVNFKESDGWFTGMFFLAFFTLIFFCCSISITTFACDNSNYCVASRSTDIPNPISHSKSTNLYEV